MCRCISQRHKMKVLVFLACVAIAQGAVGLGSKSATDSEATRSSRIINGTSVAPGEYPFVVSNQYYFNHSCGSTILSEDYILCTAHCMSKDNVEAGIYNIRAGTVLYAEGGTLHKVVEVRYHPTYSGPPYFENNVGVARVEPPFVFSDTIQPVTLAELGSDVDAGTAAVALGWGFEVSGSFKPTEDLRSVQLDVFSDAECLDLYEGKPVLPNATTLCAGAREGGFGMCNLDGGGPLLVGNVQVGILSLGAGPCGGTIPEIFEQVSYYTDWIEEQIQPAKLRRSSMSS